MIAIASDHGGYDLKERVKKYLEEKNIPYQDMGCDSKASCDYPVFGHAAARAVADGTCEKGIVICTTGIGISISANKVKGIRCALCSDPLSAKMTRLHNDANMLAMGAGIVRGDFPEYTFFRRRETQPQNQPDRRGLMHYTDTNNNEISL